jgi:hypothetical protein
LVGWPLLASRAAAELDIHTTPSQHCTRKPQITGRPSVTVEPRAGLHCVLSVQVTNNSSHAVRVDKLLGYGIADISNRGVRAAPAGGIRPYDGSPDPAKSVYAVHRWVGPGRTRVFTMALVDNPQGCKFGGTLTFGTWPTLQVHVLGRTRKVTSSTALALRNVPAERRGDGCT